MDQVLDIVNVMTAIVAAASAITAMTPTPKDDDMVAKYYKVIEMLAINVGKAKSSCEVIT